MYKLNSKYLNYQELIEDLIDAGKPYPYTLCVFTYYQHSNESTPALITKMNQGCNKNNIVTEQMFNSCMDNLIKEGYIS